MRRRGLDKRKKRRKRRDVQLKNWKCFRRRRDECSELDRRLWIRPTEECEWPEIRALEAKQNLKTTYEFINLNLMRTPRLSDGPNINEADDAIRFREPECPLHFRIVSE